MTRRPKLFITVVAICALLDLAQRPARLGASSDDARAALAAAPRIVAIGDVHGAYDSFVALLRAAGLVDGQNHWRGGNTVFVQTGDLMDRGAGVRQVLDLVMALEPEARKAGGRVEVLLGNHEVMNLTGNTRDATPEIFAAFGGYEEYRKALAPAGGYGRWLRSKPVASAIEGTLFMHAGVSPEQGPASIREITRQVRRDLDAWDQGVRWMREKTLVAAAATMQETAAAAQAQLAALEEKRVAGTLNDEDARAARVLIAVAHITSSSLFAGDGPMWFRGYATWTEAEGAEKTAALLKKYGLKRIVSGHSPLASGRITARFGGALILIDTGMLGPPTYKSGRPSALELVGDSATAIYADERVPLRHP